MSHTHHRWVGQRVPPWPWLPAQRHWACPAARPRLSPALGWPPPVTHTHTGRGEREAWFGKSRSVDTFPESARASGSASEQAERSPHPHPSLFLVPVLMLCGHLQIDQLQLQLQSLCVWRGGALFLNTRGRRPSIATFGPWERREETKGNREEGVATSRRMEERRCVWYLQSWLNMEIWSYSQLPAGNIKTENTNVA